MKKIVIAGSGGIGSNVAVNLIRAGVAGIKIIDFDKIEESNLNRQFYFYDQIGRTKVSVLKENLMRINPSCKIETVCEKINSENIRSVIGEFDILVEGFDRAEYKKLLLEEFANDGKKIVSANGIAGTDIEMVKIKNISKNIVMVGDFKSDIADLKTFSHKVQMTAAMMASIVYKYYTGV